MTFIPSKGQLLVRREKAPEQINGIYLPEESQEPPMTAIVVVAGAKTGPFRPGIRIWIDRYAGRTIQLDKEKYSLIDKAEVLGYDEGDIQF